MALVAALGCDKVWWRWLGNLRWCWLTTEAGVAMVQAKGQACDGCGRSSACLYLY